LVADVSSARGILRLVLRLAALTAAGLLALGLPEVVGAQALDGGVGGGVVSLGFWDWIGLLSRLGIVLFVMWAAFWGMRWYMQRTQSGGGARGELEVMETRVIGPNRSLQLIRVGRRAVLVGVTPERISQLLEIDDPEEVERIVQALDAQRVATPGLSGLMGSVSRLSLPSRATQRPSRAAANVPFAVLPSEETTTGAALTGGEEFAPPAGASQQLQASTAYRQARIAELQRAIEDARRGTSFERAR
jgi:flagellar biosynthetic protein FliO